MLQNGIYSIKTRLLSFYHIRRESKFFWDFIIIREMWFGLRDWVKGGVLDEIGAVVFADDVVDDSFGRKGLGLLIFGGCK